MACARPAGWSHSHSGRSASAQYLPFLPFDADPVTCRCDQRGFPPTIKPWMTIDRYGTNGLRTNWMERSCLSG